MHRKVKTKLSMSLVATLFLSMLVVLPIVHVAADPLPDFSVINANETFRNGDPDTNYGTTYFNYTNVEVPPNATNYPLGYLLVNITITNVDILKGWQINLTWDPTLLQIQKADMSYPADHVFSFPGAILQPFGKTLGVGTLFWGAALGAGSDPDSFSGTGVACQLKFNITKEPSSILFCDISHVTTGALVSALITTLGVKMPYTAHNGYYEYEWIVPPPPKPYLEVQPSVTEQGIPMGPPIIGTPGAFFEVEIKIDDIENASNLIIIEFDILYNTTLMRHVTDLATSLNATEGPFMNQTWETNRANSWAPYETFFQTKVGPDADPDGYGDILVLVILNPAPWPGDFNWTRFPDTSGLTDNQRVVCTIEFESILQEEYPWTAGSLIDIEPFFRGEDVERYFINSTHFVIEHDREDDGQYYITGWVMGRMIDVFTQYEYPYGGQGINQTSDMFEPQKTIILYAQLTFNADPVQNKPVTFQIIPPENSTLGNFTRTAVTDENGDARVSFGIPWPCTDAERDIFGVWTVIAKADIMCTTTEDWLWFKVNYYVMNLAVTPTEVEFKKDTVASFWVTFDTFSEQQVDVLITAVIYDALGVPVGSTAVWVSVGGVERRDWCQTKHYNITIEIYLPKWAFVGVGTVYVNALTNWPSNCGRAYCPEAMATFDLIRSP